MACGIMLHQGSSVRQREIQQNALERLLCAGSLRKLARELGYPDSAAGMLRDVTQGRWEHVSAHKLTDLRKRLHIAPKRKDTAMVRYDPTRTTKTPAEIKEFIYGRH